MIGIVFDERAAHNRLSHIIQGNRLLSHLLVRMLSDAELTGGDPSSDTCEGRLRITPCHLSVGMLRSAAISREHRSTVVVEIAAERIGT